MALGSVRADVISCPGTLGDAQYLALQIHVDGFKGPYVLTMAMPAIGFRALSEQVSTADLFEVLAKAINLAQPNVDVKDGDASTPGTAVRAVA